MHTQPSPFLQHLQKQYPEHFNQKKVLEAGGDARQYFSNCSYAVQSRIPGSIPVHRLDMPDAFDVIIHAGALHYDRHWISAICAMYRNVKSGGALIITCAGPKSALYEDDEQPTHFQPIGIDELGALLPASAFSTYQIGYAPATNYLQFFGVKK